MDGEILKKKYIREKALMFNINIKYLFFTAYTHKFKRIFHTQETVLKDDFKDLNETNIYI